MEMLLLLGPIHTGRVFLMCTNDWTSRLYCFKNHG